jgi:hypothetical protein
MKLSGLLFFLSGCMIAIGFLCMPVLNIALASWTIGLFLLFGACMNYLGGE